MYLIGLADTSMSTRLSFAGGPFLFLAKFATNSGPKWASLWRDSCDLDEWLCVCVCICISFIINIHWPANLHSYLRIRIHIHTHLIFIALFAYIRNKWQLWLYPDHFSMVKHNAKKWTKIGVLNSSDPKILWPSSLWMLSSSRPSYYALAEARKFMEGYLLEYSSNKEDFHEFLSRTFLISSKITSFFLLRCVPSFCR